MKIKSRLSLSFLLIFMTFTLKASPSQSRFFLEGDGLIRLVNAKSGVSETVVYRSTDGTCPEKERMRLNRIFDIPQNSEETISLRLIALLDYLQDKLHGGTIRIVSGYRSPQYNEGLRKKGRLAAKTSLHIEGMAADIDMEGVDGKRLWEFARGLNCCGVGYYHGKGIHIDVGPNRFWDETSTKVEQDLGRHNKLVFLTTDRDIYHPGETVHLILARVTDYPVGVRIEGKGPCTVIHDRQQTRSLNWKIPADFKRRDRMEIPVDFCEKPFPEMPDRVASNPISVMPSNNRQLIIREKSTVTFLCLQAEKLRDGAWTQAVGCSFPFVKPVPPDRRRKES